MQKTFSYWPLFIIGMLLAALISAGCDTLFENANPISSNPQRVVSLSRDGDPQAGRQLIQAYGCGSCHTIPGVIGADALVGPPLNSFSQRSYIAGSLENNWDNLIAWIQDPQAFEPGTAMPNLGVRPEEAQHMAAYLYELTQGGLFSMSGN